MIAYKTNKSKLIGTRAKDIGKQAKSSYKIIQSRTKRAPYIRSQYFKKEKIFLKLFWQHIYQKHERNRVRRLKFFDCGLDLIRNSVNHPTTKENPNRKEELLHRFAGITRQNEIFYVQIKENKRSGRKDLISIFPG